jgi:hypothetical protein
VGAIGSLIVLLIVLLLVGGGSSGPTTSTATTATKKHAAKARHPAGKSVARGTLAPVVTLALSPSAVVYVCLIGDNERKLIPGLELQPGETTPTYHARRFKITLGNSSLKMIVDGQARTVPPSSQAIGYSITKARGRQRLAAGQLPTCK